MIILKISAQYWEKLLFKDTEVRLKASKLRIQINLCGVLELYISGSTNPRKVVFLQVETPLVILEKTKFSILK